MSELFSELPEQARSVRIATYARRAVVVVFAVVMGAGLANVVGQAARTDTATAPAATMRVKAPNRVRGGLLFQTRIDLDVRRGFERPRLVFDPGVFEGMQVSSIEPAAMSESSRDGRVVLSYEPLAAGDRFTLWMQFQVDPTHIGRHSYGIELDEGTRRVARVDRNLRVLP